MDVVMFGGLLRAHTTVGFRRAIGQLREEWHAQVRHFRGSRRARALSFPPGVKLHVGCGSNVKPGWLNIDLWNPAADVSLDLREPWPFTDRCASVVYSEHVLEHFEYPGDVKHLLKESFRVLQKGGRISIGVPDHGLAMQAYVCGDLTFFDVRRLRSYLLDETPTVMHHLNYSMRQDGLHKYSYDEETLSQILRDVGFLNPRRRPFDPELDSEKRHLVRTLYMDAERSA